MQQQLMWEIKPQSFNTPVMISVIILGSSLLMVLYFNFKCLLFVSFFIIHPDCLAHDMLNIQSIGCSARSLSCLS